MSKQQGGLFGTQSGRNDAAVHGPDNPVLPPARPCEQKRVLDRLLLGIDHDRAAGQLKRHELGRGHVEKHGDVVHGRGDRILPDVAGDAVGERHEQQGDGRHERKKGRRRRYASVWLFAFMHDFPRNLAHIQDGRKIVLVRQYKTVLDLVIPVPDERGICMIGAD